MTFPFYAECMHFVEFGSSFWNDAGALDINEASFINNVANNIILLELFGSMLVLLTSVKLI